jgi:hypothetical protein
MPSARTPDQARATLSRQHDELRERIARCEQLVEDFDAGLLPPSQLLAEVTALRLAFDDHNQFEERVLRPMLLPPDRHGGVRDSRIVDDHIAEHRAIRRELSTGTASELRAVLASLREHLDSEERGLLSA